MANDYVGTRIGKEYFSKGGFTVEVDVKTSTYRFISPTGARIEYVPNEVIGLQLPGLPGITYGVNPQTGDRTFSVRWGPIELTGSYDPTTKQTTAIAGSATLNENGKVSLTSSFEARNFIISGGELEATIKASVKVGSAIGGFDVFDLPPTVVRGDGGDLLGISGIVRADVLAALRRIAAGGSLNSDADRQLRELLSPQSNNLSPEEQTELLGNIFGSDEVLAEGALSGGSNANLADQFASIFFSPNYNGDFEGLSATNANRFRSNLVDELAGAFDSQVESLRYFVSKSGDAFIYTDSKSIWVSAGGGVLTSTDEASSVISAFRFIPASETTGYFPSSDAANLDGMIAQTEQRSDPSALSEDSGEAIASAINDIAAVVNLIQKPNAVPGRGRQPGENRRGIDRTRGATNLL